MVQRMCIISPATFQTDNSNQLDIDAVDWPYTSILRRPN